MKYFVTSLLIVIISVSATFNSVSANSDSTRPYNILILGDSISAAYGIEQEQGWVNLLNDRLLSQTENYQAVNASISGDTTIGGLTRLPLALRRYTPEIVIVELGGNDGLRGYPITKIKANLAQLVEQSIKAGAKVLVLGMKLPPNYGHRYASSFEQMFLEVASDSGVAVLPFMLDGIATDSELMQGDGIHPTAAAQPRIMELVWSQLEDLLVARSRVP